MATTKTVTGAMIRIETPNPASKAIAGRIIELVGGAEAVGAVIGRRERLGESMGK